MTEDEAQELARVVDGKPWNSGGGIWLVCRERQDGHVVAFSDEVVSEYLSWDVLQDGSPLNSIVIV